MEFLSPYHIIAVQQRVEKEQNLFLNRDSLDAIAAKIEFYCADLAPVEVAMTYFEDIVNKHIFQNGNKRTAIISAILFLEMNGYRLLADGDELYDAILAYFPGKQIEPLKNLLSHNLSQRSYPNTAIQNPFYHLDGLVSKYQNLIVDLAQI